MHWCIFLHTVSTVFVFYFLDLTHKYSKRSMSCQHLCHPVVALYSFQFVDICQFLYFQCPDNYIVYQQRSYDSRVRPCGHSNAHHGSTAVFISNVCCFDSIVYVNLLSKLRSVVFRSYRGFNFFIIILFLIKRTISIFLGLKSNEWTLLAPLFYDFKSYLLLIIDESCFIVDQPRIYTC